jgi:hypothetical protein
MPQTILAIFAMVSVSLFSLNLSRLTADSQTTMMRQAVGQTATGLAIEQFEYIGSKKFDANSPVTSTEQLTTADRFGGAASWSAAADVDDFHGLTHTATMEMGQGTAQVMLAATVVYVQKQGNTFSATTTRSPYKRVTLQVTGPLGYKATISRIYSMYRSVPGA